MHRLTCVVPAMALILSGCGDVRPAPVAGIPAAAPAAQPPVDLLGTWTDAAGGGFVAIGARQIVVAMDGAPRAVAALTENGIEPGMSAGMLGLADGTALFVARGSSVVDGIPVDHLDVEVVRTGVTAPRRRLLSESGLRLASRIATRPPSQRSDSPASRFVGAVPDTRRPDAVALTEQSGGGAGRGAVAAMFGERQRTAFVGILALLEQARALPHAQADERLREAGRRLADADAFASAWQAWTAGGG